MNKKQKSILAGRKPKHHDNKLTLDDAAKLIRGMSPVAAFVEWFDAMVEIERAQLRYFQLAALPVLEEVKRRYPNCTCTWEDVQPLEPIIVGSTCRR